MARRLFLHYVAVLDGRTRPKHRDWHDTVLPVDHAWWRRFYLPNGWRCRCIVQQLSQRDLDRRGPSVTRALTPPLRGFRNRRTGRVTRVPDGIDPGWAHNAGQVHMREARRQLNRRLELSGPDVARAGIVDGLAEPEFGAFAGGTIEGRWAVAALPEPLADRIGARVSAVFLSRETALKQTVRQPEVVPAGYRLLRRTLDAGEAVQQGPRHLVFHHQVEGRWWAAVVKASRDGRELYAVTFSRSNAKRRLRTRRRGEVVREGG